MTIHRRAVRPSPAISAAPLFAACALALAACGGEGGSDSSATGASPTGGDGVDFGDTTSGVDSTSTCATGAFEGAKVPVTMYLMFDKSGSMLDDQKWAGAVAALIAFFQDDESAGLSVALRFFPDDAPVSGCNEVACSADACAQPLVDVGELTVKPATGDPQQKALVDAVKSRQPGGETPMFAALAGAEQWAKARAASTGDQGKTVVVLVTDGEPNGCTEDIGAIAGLAGDAFASSGVYTYAIGMEGSNQAQLDQIAAAGHTNEAFVIGTQSVHTELVEALSSIGTTQLACEMGLPASNDGTPVDPAKVNVEYTPASGPKQTLVQVGGAGECSGGGWYYDDAQNPSKITLCPTTCDTVQNDLGSKLQVVLGCATVVN